MNQPTKKYYQERAAQTPGLGGSAVAMERVFSYPASAMPPRDAVAVDDEAEVYDWREKAQSPTPAQTVAPTPAAPLAPRAAGDGSDVVGAASSPSSSSAGSAAPTSPTASTAPVGQTE